MTLTSHGLGGCLSVRAVISQDILVGIIVALWRTTWKIGTRISQVLPGGLVTLKSWIYVQVAGW